MWECHPCVSKEEVLSTVTVHVDLLRHCLLLVVKYYNTAATRTKLKVIQELVFAYGSTTQRCNAEKCKTVLAKTKPTETGLANLIWAC